VQFRQSAKRGNMKKLNRFLDELKSGEFSLTKMPYFGGEK
jgi:hypothetical protein